jgi:hypothetical protein
MKIDRYEQRLQAMHFRMTFEERYIDLSNVSNLTSRNK